MKYFILAGGLGKRVLPLSDFYPKPLLPLNGKSLLQRMLHHLTGLGLREGFINIHHRADLMRKFVSNRPNLKIFHEVHLSGNKVLRKAVGDLEDHLLLVVNGDVLADIPVEEMREKMRETDADCVLLVKVLERPQYRTLRVKDGRFLIRNSTGGQKSGPGMIFTGIFLIREELLPGIDELNIFDYFEKNNFKIFTCVLDSPWIDIGSPSLYFNADRQVRNRESANLNNSLSPNVKISDDSEVTHSVIWENTRIKNSKINRCIVTGNIKLNDLTCTDKIVYTRNGRIEMVKLD